MGAFEYDIKLSTTPLGALPHGLDVLVLDCYLCVCSRFVDATMARF